MRLEIPALNLEAEIVGVTTDDQGWDLTWLWNRVGYLEGTAFPSWPGNTALTGHVVLPNGLPGTFAQLGQLTWNDHIWLYANGLRYEYRVTYQWKTHPHDLSVFNHEDLDVLTLITCADYDPSHDSYRQRTIVRAVLIQVEDPSSQP
jgi:LPXTG-site transpeptidase (sortase) family protein